jgi:DNA-binding transcriptional MerR regulator
MNFGSDALWTIDELGAEVASALAVGYEGAPSGRVRDVPDRRTIRYYTTLGLLDRPAAMRGRTALYGRRHLRQLVAIKRLQARGLSLAEVQARLVGLTDSALAELAGLGEGSAPTRASGSFWKATPGATPPRNAPEPLQGVRLAEGVTLLLETSRPIRDEDLATIRMAAAPLIEILQLRRLIRSREGEGMR